MSESSIIRVWLDPDWKLKYQSAPPGRRREMVLCGVPIRQRNLSAEEVKDLRQRPIRSPRHILDI